MSHWKSKVSRDEKDWEVEESFMVGRYNLDFVFGINLTCLLDIQREISRGSCSRLWSSEEKAGLEIQIGKFSFYRCT